MAANTTSYDPVLFDEILGRLAQGESLNAICRDEHMPHRSTVAKWVYEDIQGCSVLYARARDMGLDKMAEELIEIADSPQVGVIETDKLTKAGEPYTEVQRRDMTQHRQIRIDVRKWYLCKLAPKRYGDKLELEHKGDMSISQRILQARERVKK